MTRNKPRNLARAKPKNQAVSVEKVNTEIANLNRALDAISRTEESVRTESDEKIKFILMRTEVLTRASELQGHYDLGHLKAALDAIEHDTGCTSPTEHFIDTLLEYYSRDGLTPERAAKALETYRTDFDEMLGSAKQFAKRYPDLMGEKELIQEESHA